jgi:hypothetical protein
LGIVRATHSTGAFATALVQLKAIDGNTYSIAPANPIIAAGSSVTLTLVDAQGRQVSGGIWLVTPQVIGSQYTFSAPAYSSGNTIVTVMLQAPNSPYNYPVAFTTIIVEPAPIEITGQSPTVGHIGEQVTLQAAISDPIGYVWFTMSNGSKDRVLGAASSDGVTVTIPHGAVSGPTWIEEGSIGGATFLSQSFPIVILPRLRLHASRPRVSSGETIQITATAPDQPTLAGWHPRGSRSSDTTQTTPESSSSLSLTWRADFGTVDAEGHFVAPAVIAPTFARIWACLLGDTECGTTVVEVVQARGSGPQLVDNFPASPFMIDLQVRGNYLYWTGAGGPPLDQNVTHDIFEVVDVFSFPPQVVATMDRPTSEAGLAIELIGNYAYVGAESELIVYDISSPASPVLVTAIPTPAFSFALNGNYLYAGNPATQVLVIYDVSNPGNPRQIGSMPLPDYAFGLATQPGWLAVALGESGMGLYSLGNPAAPVPASQGPGTFWGFAGSGNYLYGAADIVGLEVFDVTNLQNPMEIGTAPLAAGDELPGDVYPFALAVSLDPRGIAWVCTSKDGRVYGIDIRNPNRPRHIAEFTTDLGSNPVENAPVAGGVLFAAGNDAAFEVTTPQNVGLYLVDQSAPGEVLPDRLNAPPPLLRAMARHAAKPKEHMVHRRRPEQQRH